MPEELDQTKADPRVYDLTTLYTSGLYMPTKTVHVIGEVNEDLYGSVALSLEVALANGLTDITVKLNSPGGDVYHGMAIYDLLLSIPGKLTIEAGGYVMSAASIILQAADERVLLPNAAIMIHDGEEAIQGKPEDVRAWIKYQDTQAEMMYGVYASRSGKAPEVWRKLCKRDTIFTAEEAVAAGLADRVKAAKTFPAVKRRDRKSVV